MVDEEKNESLITCYFVIRNINIHYDYEWGFATCCKEGKMDMVKWLLEISYRDKKGIINIHAMKEEPFQGKEKVSCRRKMILLIK